MTGFGISSVECLGSVTRELIVTTNHLKTGVPNSQLVQNIPQIKDNAQQN
jgi:hypothetical protein